ncbi:MAG: hypothetical protein RRA35_04420 [Desulfomonilia bacterium]|nr:hypothetical protein [Desulfomonilia bacterium]
MQRKIVFMVTGLVLVSLLATGCARLKESMPGFSSAPAVQASSRYLDFGDVLIPGDLVRVHKESYITNGHGRLMLSGRIESETLSQFFVTSMYSDGWVALNQYKFQGSIKMFFKKRERIASLLITEHPLGTRVEIWVVPQEKM